jgi:hypothetical protein
MTTLLRSKLVADRPSMASILGRGEVNRVAPSDPARLYRHIAEVREQRGPGSAVIVIAAMPDGRARTALARRFRLA